MKFKELRLLFICFIAFLGMVILCGYALILHDHKRLILTLVLSIIALDMGLRKFNIRLFDECMLIYEYKIIGLLPTIIEYENITEVQAITQYKVKINHTKISTIYVINSRKFVRALTQLLDKRNKTHEKN